VKSLKEARLGCLFSAKWPWGLLETGSKGQGSWHFLALAVLLNQPSRNASRVQIPLGHVIGTLVLTQQADRSAGCTRGRKQADTQFQLLALRLGTGRDKRYPLHLGPSVSQDDAGVWSLFGLPGV
jgi:hypothetical protein